jgi:hypothetical protein
MLRTRPRSQRKLPSAAEGVGDLLPGSCQGDRQRHSEDEQARRPRRRRPPGRVHGDRSVDRVGQHGDEGHGRRRRPCSSEAHGRREGRRARREGPCRQRRAAEAPRLSSSSRRRRTSTLKEATRSTRPSSSRRRRRPTSRPTRQRALGLLQSGQGPGRGVRQDDAGCDGSRQGRVRELAGSHRREDGFRFSARPLTRSRT